MASKQHWSLIDEIQRCFRQICRMRRIRVRYLIFLRTLRANLRDVDAYQVCAWCGQLERYKVSRTVSSFVLGSRNMMPAADTAKHGCSTCKKISRAGGSSISGSKEAAMKVVVAEIVILLVLIRWLCYHNPSSSVHGLLLCLLIPNAWHWAIKQNMMPEFPGVETFTFTFDLRM